MSDKELLELVEVVDSPHREEVRVYVSKTADLLFLVHYHEIEEQENYSIDPRSMASNDLERWVLQEHKDQILDMIG
jgi:hypothetical protein